MTSLAGVLLFPFLLLSAGAPAPTADDIATALLESKDYVEASSRLKQLHNDLPNPTWALKPLLDRVVAGTDNSEHLKAVCHADAWSDGAWWLEMQSAAYDAVGAAPGNFVRRYLDGNDCALLVLIYALKWPSESLDIIHECESTLGDALAQTDRDLAAIRSQVLSMVDLHDPAPRHRVIFATVNVLVDAWPPNRDDYLRWCKQQKEEGQSSP